MKIKKRRRIRVYKVCLNGIYGFHAFSIKEASEYIASHLSETADKETLSVTPELVDPQKFKECAEFDGF